MRLTLHHATVGGHTRYLKPSKPWERMIEHALRRQSAGNKQKAAQELGLSRQGLIKKLKRLGM